MATLLANLHKLRQRQLKTKIALHGVLLVEAAKSLFFCLKVLKFNRRFAAGFPGQMFPVTGSHLLFPRLGYGFCGFLLPLHPLPPLSLAYRVR